MAKSSRKSFASLSSPQGGSPAPQDDRLNHNQPVIHGTAPARLRRMHDLLAAAYGPQRWWPAETSFEVVLGAYLTQNTAWTAVERSLANLRKAGAMSIEGLRAVPMRKLETLIRPSGFHTRKAPALKAFVALLDDEFDGALEKMAAAPTESLRRRLLALPGVGAETADAILLYALGHSVPLADEYLRRIAERHHLLHPTPQRNRKGYEALVRLTRDAFAQDPAADRARLFNEFHALTVAVGKAHCGRNAKCEHCPLAADLAGVSVNPASVRTLPKERQAKPADPFQPAQRRSSTATAASRNRLRSS